MSISVNPDQQPEHQPNTERAFVPAQPEVENALLKFWDAVHTSAELIVTLRQEVVQLRAQNNTLREAEAEARATTSSSAEDVARIAELELQVEAMRSEIVASKESSLEIQSTLEATLVEAQQLRGEQEVLVAERETLITSNNTLAEERNTLASELAQVRVDLCELELQASSKDAEIHTMQDQLAILQQRCEELAGLVSDARDGNHTVVARTQEEVATLQAKNDSLEKRLNDALLAHAELKSTADRMKSEKSQLNEDYSVLADKYQGIEKNVAELENALRSAEQALQQAQEKHVDETEIVETGLSEQNLEVEAMKNRLSELELIAVHAASSDAKISELHDEIADLTEQLEDAMGIIEAYREAGLRHIEDLDQRNQLTLFASLASKESKDIVENTSSYTGLSAEEVAELAAKLDDLADRVAQLLGIS